MSRNSLFHGLNRDSRAQKLFDVVRTHVLAGDHDPVYPYEVCTAKPPTTPSDTHVWEPAQTRAKRSAPQIAGSLTCTLSWDPSRGQVIVSARYWRRSGQWFRPRKSGEFGGGFAGFTYEDCRRSMDIVAITEKLVKGGRIPSVGITCL